MNTNGMVKETGRVAMTTKSKNRRAHRRENKKDMIYQFIITALLCVIALVAIVPLLSVLALSFSSKNAVNMNAVSLVPGIYPGFLESNLCKKRYVESHRDHGSFHGDRNSNGIADHFHDGIPPFQEGV